MIVAIRPAKTSDIQAITRIYAHAVEHGTASFELTPPDEAEMTRRMNDLTGKGYPYLAGEIDGALAGYAYAGPYRARPAYRLTVEDSVYIAPDRHRRSIGRALLAALIEATAARGFRQVGILQDVGFKHGRWLDSVLMQRALGDGRKTEA